MEAYSLVALRIAAAVGANNAVADEMRALSIFLMRSVNWSTTTTTTE